MYIGSLIPQLTFICSCAGDVEGVEKFQKRLVSNVIYCACGIRGLGTSGWYERPSLQYVIAICSWPT